MVIKVMYCKPRKDGSCNYVLFDTEKKEIIDGYYGGGYVFVEAKMSKKEKATIFSPENVTVGRLDIARKEIYERLLC